MDGSGPVTRRHIAFSCAGAGLFGTLDLPAGAASAGLLIVSGGNEVRAGAWNGQALLAARIAAAGYPVLRFDRRGVGESEGENRGFRHAADDIAAALAALRAEVPALRRVVALGNCDAASALMLGSGCGADGLILSNPWTIEPDEAAADGEAPTLSPATLPPAALRAHYLRRLTDPAALWRLLRGGVALGGLIGSLRAMAKRGQPTALGKEIAQGLARFSGPVRLLVAERDRTGQAFLGQWNKADARLARCPGASHSFVEPEAFDWLVNQTIATLSEQSA